MSLQVCDWLWEEPVFHVPTDRVRPGVAKCPRARSPKPDKTLFKLACFSLPPASSEAQHALKLEWSGYASLLSLLPRRKKAQR